MHERQQHRRVWMRERSYACTWKYTGLHGVHHQKVDVGFASTSGQVIDVKNICSD
jgi:hypothetical protein